MSAKKIDPAADYAAKLAAWEKRTAGELNPFEREMRGETFANVFQPAESATAKEQPLILTIEESLAIVIKLARQASGTWTDWAEHARQLEAIATVEDMAVNQFGDD